VDARHKAGHGLNYLNASEHWKITTGELATARGLDVYRLVGPASYAFPGAGLETILAVLMGSHPLPL
jgi:hypothetical protein